jgi:hypothetical protein
LAADKGIQKSKNQPSGTINKQFRFIQTPSLNKYNIYRTLEKPLRPLRLGKNLTARYANEAQVTQKISSLKKVFA